MTQQVWMGRGRPDALTGGAQQVGRGRLTRSRVRIGSTVLVALAALAALTATFQTYADPRLLFMDVIAGAQVSGYCCRGYYGVMSNMGAIGWALAAGVALFAALCLWARGGAHADGLLLGLAVFSVWPCVWTTCCCFMSPSCRVRVFHRWRFSAAMPWPVWPMPLLNVVDRFRETAVFCSWPSSCCEGAWLWTSCCIPLKAGWLRPKTG